MMSGKTGETDQIMKFPMGIPSNYLKCQMRSAVMKDFIFQGAAADFQSEILSLSVYFFLTIDTVKIIPNIADKFDTRQSSQ